jgi:hypothetical protein
MRCNGGLTAEIELSGDGVRDLPAEVELLGTSSGEPLAFEVFGGAE